MYLARLDFLSTEVALCQGSGQGGVVADDLVPPEVSLLPKAIPQVFQVKDNVKCMKLARERESSLVPCASLQCDCLTSSW